MVGEHKAVLVHAVADGLGECVVVQGGRAESPTGGLGGQDGDAGLEGFVEAVRVVGLHRRVSDLAVDDHLKVGDEVRLNGPYGDFCLSDTDAPMVFIAGGSGMAPIKSILHQMKNTGSKRKATYYFGANKVDELFLTDEMKEFESDLANFEFVPVVANPEENKNWEGETGLVTEAVKRTLTNASECEAYLCGSPGMIDAANIILMELGMKEENIFFDKFE